MAGEPQVTLKNDKGMAVVFQKKDLKDRTYRVEFTAPVAGVYTSTVTFGGKAVPRSPFTINVLSSPDASKVKVYGPALERPVNVNEVTHFIVDCKEAGQGVQFIILLDFKNMISIYQLILFLKREYFLLFVKPKHPFLLLKQTSFCHRRASSGGHECQGGHSSHEDDRSGRQNL